jgi:hypothetical protein
MSITRWTKWSVVAALVFWTLPVASAAAQHGCPADRPCIQELYQNGTTIIVGWDGHEDFNHYNVRWSRPGRDETQSEVNGGNSGSFRINNVHPGVRYTIKVQGCNRNLLGESSCTPWYEDSIVAESDLPFGPDTCRQGYVWREANARDHVCVLPQTRSQTAEENRLAASRRNPAGGPYGRDTCHQGFVWREAFAGDHVCVTPSVRSQAAEDNRLASSRRAR